MCGIAGFIADHSTDTSVVILRRMLTRMHHRGPDESGVYVRDGFGMGSVRLSIQDIQTGGMPLSDQQGKYWIVFNGEIFNFIELREELKKKGHRFSTTGDTEVIVHLYEEYGIEFLNKLNGQFAISIWDTEKGELLLARDRIGIRPLYYTKTENYFLFASEVKSFMEYPEFSFRISPKVLSQFFTFWTSIDNETIFEDIYEVPPGSYMTIRKGQISTGRFWEIPVSGMRDFSRKKIEQCIEELDELLEDSVRIRLRADVQVAAYLSGGLDSTLTTYYIHKLKERNLSTFSLGFDDEEFDETEFQELASRYFNTRHTAISVGNKDISESFENTIWHTEAPILRTSPIPMFRLSKAVNDRGIKVVITGEGADELFGGYNIFKEAKIRHFWAKDVNSKFRPLLLKKLYPYLPAIKGASPAALQLFFGHRLKDTDSPIYSHLIRWNNTSRIKSYISEDAKAMYGAYDPVLHYLNNLGEKLNGLDYLAKASFIEMQLFLAGYLLSSQGDRVSMAHSVEGRYPFLDHRVMEFALQLPSEFKLKGLNEKYILKKLVAGRIPEKIIHRSKQAYRAPVNNVLLENNVNPSFREYLDKTSLVRYGLFDAGKVMRLIQKFDENVRISETDKMGLTGILSTQLIHNLFVKRSKGELKQSEIINLDKIIIDKKEN